MILSLSSVIQTSPQLLVHSKAPLLALQDWEQSINLEVWDKVLPVKAKYATPVVIKLTGPIKFPSHKQYPMKPEAYEGLQPLISKFMRYELLVPTTSPYSTLMIVIKKILGISCSSRPKDY